MNKEEAIKILKENSCSICSYCAKNMESCDIRYCDNREAIRTLEKEIKESKDIHLPLYKVGDRIEPGTDGYAYKMTISNGKEFEQQPCKDAVSREELKKWLDMNFSFGGALKKLELFDRLDKELPSVTPITSWIPFSKEQPKDRDWYLGIFKESDTGWINPIPYICDYVGHETVITTKEYWILKGFTDRDKHIDYYYNLECVAWHPLPEPYQEEKE